MKLERPLRTKDLAAAAQFSVQQVRNYEASGFIPPAERSPNGYRRYTPRHLAALTTARTLVAGYGPQRARAIMQAVYQRDLPAALTQLDEHHAALANQRLRLDQTLAALNHLAAQSARLAATRPSQRLHVGAAAAQVGVRVSAVRFWEDQGLLHPARDERSRYRLYDERQLRRLRVVALLREANFDFDAIRTTLDELAAGRPEQAIAAVEQRRAVIARATWASLTALAAFHTYIATHHPHLPAPG
jgi:DNA-binding transcriptional MerR regulator